jgi:hypothetical protein
LSLPDPSLYFVAAQVEQTGRPLAKLGPGSMNLIPGKA